MRAIPSPRTGRRASVLALPLAGCMKLDRWPLSVTPCSGMQEKEQRTFVMKMLLRRRECAEPEVTGEVGLGGVLLGESEGKDIPDLGQMR